MKIVPTKPELPELLSDGTRLLEYVRSMPLPEGTEGTRFLDNLRVLEEAIALGRTRMKGLLAESPYCVPNWQLFPGSSVRELHGDSSKLREALGDELSEEAFIDAGKWSFSALEAAYMEEHSVDRAAAAMAINRLLERAGLISIRQNAPTLKRI
jgi:hypothetical protein